MWLPAWDQLPSETCGVVSCRACTTLSPQGTACPAEVSQVSPVMQLSAWDLLHDLWATQGPAELYLNRNTVDKVI